MCPAVHAQGLVTTWAQSYGVGSYFVDQLHPSAEYSYGSGGDFPTGITQMPDGGYVVAGQLDLPKFGSGHVGDKSEATLVRYSADGTLLWERYLRPDLEDDDGRSTNPVLVFRVLADPAGNIFICGGNPFPIVAKFTAGGALIWKNGLNRVLVQEPDASNATGFTFYPYGVGPFTAMTLTADGGVIAGARELEGANYHSIPFIARFDASGAPNLHAAFENAVQDNGVAAVCQSRDNRFIAVVPQLSPSLEGSPIVETSI